MELTKTLTMITTASLFWGIERTLSDVPSYITGHMMLFLVAAVGLIAYYVYKSIKPPPPIPLPENVSEISPRIKLNDGRYLAYRELGFPKDKAKNKIIILHGFGSSKLVDLKITQVLI